MSELKPCPFCGGEYTQVRYIGWKSPSAFDSGYRAECCDCGVITAAYPTKAEAAAAWNTRHNLEEDALPMTDENMAAHGWKQIKTCKVVGSYYSELMDVYVFSFSCRDSIWWNDEEPPNYCPDCGRKVES